MNRRTEAILILTLSTTSLAVSATVLVGAILSR